MHPPIRSYKDKWVAARVANISIALLALSIGGHSQDEQKADARENWNQQVKEQYAKHDAKIRKLLPPHSAMPLVLDLSRKRVEDGICDPQQHAAWEKHFNGTMGARVADLGVSEPSDATGTTFTTIDTFAPSYSLPAKGCSLIAVVKPIHGKVCIPQSRRYVYTKYTLQVLKEFQKGNKVEEPPFGSSRQVTAVELGGTVRFPSGYLETYLLDQRGFMEVGKEYLVFLWNPIPSDELMMVAEAYLIQDGTVFPVNTKGDAQTVYTKMPLPEFEAKVKEAVKRNVDADVFPNVHAPSH